MTMKRASRLGVAIRIRDVAHEKVRNDGQFVDTNVGPLLVWKGDTLEISHHTPFQIFPAPSDHVLKQCYEAGDVPKFNLPYGLDIWGVKGKVFNIEWDHEYHVELISFNRGEWEEKVLHHM